MTDLPLYRQKVIDILGALGSEGGALPLFVHEDGQGRRLSTALDRVIRPDPDEVSWYVKQARRDGGEFIRIYVRHKSECSLLKPPGGRRVECTCDPDVKVERREEWGKSAGPL